MDFFDGWKDIEEVAYRLLDLGYEKPARTCYYSLSCTTPGCDFLQPSPVNTKSYRWKDESHLRTHLRFEKT